MKIKLKIYSKIYHIRKLEWLNVEILLAPKLLFYCWCSPHLKLKSSCDFNSPWVYEGAFKLAQNCTSLKLGHMQRDVCTYLCMRNLAQYQLNDTEKSKDIRENFTLMKHDLFKIDRIKMIKWRTRQVISTAKWITITWLRQYFTEQWLQVLLLGKMLLFFIFLKTKNKTAYWLHLGFCAG